MSKTKRSLTLTDRDGKQQKIEIVKAFERPENSEIALQVEISTGNKAVVSFNPKLIDLKNIECICIDRDEE